MAIAVAGHAQAASRIPPLVPPTTTIAPDVVTPLAPITYHQFAGDCSVAITMSGCSAPCSATSCQETLIPWQGAHVTVLVDPTRVRSPAVMTELVSALDRAWSYYAEITGRVPAPTYSLNGRDEIPEVPDDTTCGAGCTHLGETGTEIAASYFESMYSELAQSDVYDQIPFYELGRSFWFWTRQLAPPEANGNATKYDDAVITGFAVWMRFRSMTAAGVQGAPLDITNEPFATLVSQSTALAGEYEEDPSWTFANTLAVNASPDPSTGLGGTDFWASLMTQLAWWREGNGFVEQFWHDASQLPSAGSTDAAVTNWVRAASEAACQNLDLYFYDILSFPRANGSVMKRSRFSPVLLKPTNACVTATHRPG